MPFLSGMFTCESQSSVVVKRPHCNDKDVGSNPTATRNELDITKGFGQ